MERKKRNGRGSKVGNWGGSEEGGRKGERLTVRAMRGRGDREKGRRKGETSEI